jgi:glycerophosphoryl diester phosphodiesterase
MTHLTHCHHEHTPPALVAHRGDAGRHPENTLVSIRAALEAGVRAVEFDVQFSRDQVPVVLHDENLRRTTGVDAAVFDLDVDRIRVIEIEAGITVPTLAEMVAELRAWPEATAFVEIKRASLRRFGVGPVVERVLRELQPVLLNTVVISFDREAIEVARRSGGARIGWVLDAWDDAALSTAGTLAPEYLFCDLPLAGDPLWPGPWQWVVYGVETVEAAMAMAGRGADLVETRALGVLLDALEPRA